ncbi:hypothetical protein ACFO3J_30050 [Streptomyces polygonati]|uniref:DUF732 domain-containing protein n=1 Tax=Streptomyces polygonati TaxID=1617087 RepID=A0ABV8HXQ4_9ACTN
MRIRIAAAAVAAAALLTLTACDSGDDKASVASAPSVDISSIKVAAGIPSAPDGEARKLLLSALISVDPWLAEDMDKTVDAARSQCQSLNGGAADPDHLAAQRFGNDASPLTDEQGKLLNVALRATLCPKS